MLRLQASNYRSIILPMAYTNACDQELLQAALIGYEHQLSMLDERITEIRRELNGAGIDGTGESPRKGGMSAAGRFRVAAAQRKRWAEHRKAEGTSRVPRRKRIMSAAGRKRIAEATRKRWAAYRAAKAAAAR